ncbi:MAG TPA: penicillin acylase family protein, partial [Flavobacteriaceae bacterium]|nr:penicillin acylase family protein [Flavobacteriaceae bacterium]
FAMAHKTDPLLSLLQEKLGDEYLQYLNISVNPNSTLKRNFKGNTKQLETIVANVNQVLSNTPSPQFIGSNAWVLAGDKTASGKVLFANDPHIGYSQPPVWYEAHLSTPNYEMYGYHIAGVPFPLLGHNHKLAFGLTMFENDDMDFYQEENHPTDSLKYKTANGYKKYKTKTATIKVKDSASVKINIKKTVHGPIVNNALETVEQHKPIAVSWAYLKHKNQLLEALYTMVSAKNMEHVKQGVSLIHAPGLNVMYGDADGNIAWWASGKLYEFKPHVNPKFVLNGTTGKDEPIQFLDFESNPMAENPPWNYVYSANNQPDSINGNLYPGYYLPEDRAKRIKTLLEAKNNWKKEDFKGMLTDVTSSTSPKLIKKVFDVIDLSDFSENEKEKLQILKTWDGANTKNSIATTIYNKWIYVYLKNTFKDEMGDTIFNHLLNTHLMKRTIAEHIDFEESLWWDDVSTSQKESRKDIFTRSLKQTILALEKQLGKNTENWTWNNVHTLEHKHPLGNVKALRRYFNVGTFAMQGAREVIDNRGYLYDSTGVYNIYSGPSTRRIIDFSDVENSLSILPTGQSGNPFSKHYKDQAEMYNAGKFRKMKLNKEEIINTSTTLTFIPKNE